MFLKVRNMNYNGIIDYKGLDIEKFVRGSQVYDFENNIFLVKTTDDINFNDDIIQITEDEYVQYSLELQDKINSQRITIEEQLDTIEKSILELAGVI